MNQKLNELYECLKAYKATNKKPPYTITMDQETCDELCKILEQHSKKYETRAKKKCPNCNRKPHVWYCMNRMRMVKCPKCGLAAKQFKTEIDAIRDWNKMIDLMSSNSQ